MAGFLMMRLAVGKVSGDQVSSFCAEAGYLTVVAKREC